MQDATEIQRRLDAFRAERNGPPSPEMTHPHDCDRVSITVSFRNCDGNKLRTWIGRYVDFKSGHALAACEASFQDALHRKSPIVEAPTHVRD